MANAALARIQSYKLPGYEERGMKWIRLAGKPAVRWAFHTAGERSGIDYFFEECGISFVVRGTMGNVAYESLSESFREMAATIKVKRLRRIACAPRGATRLRFPGRAARRRPRAG
jgi:hypothetical protein